MRKRLLLLWILMGGWSVSGDDMPAPIRSFLNQYCLECHGGDKVKGEVDFSLIRSDADMNAHFELWETVIELIEEGEMPPEDAAQPDAESKQVMADWYQDRFVRSVRPHPGFFQPRRLSAHEYRNTLRSVFGFDLEVQIIEAEQTVVERSLVLKLLPTDPPGRSGFTNDTHGNPLTPLIWHQYAYLVDQALEALFSGGQPAALASLSGNLPLEDNPLAFAEAVLTRFLPRVYRRPVKPADLEEGLEQLRSSKDPLTALRVEMKAALMSPAFLYRGLLMPRTEEGQQAVDAYELAERLSYFIWGDMPDEALLALAESGELLDEAVLERQLDTMIRSPRSRHLAESLGWQWFALSDMEQATRQVPVLEALRSQVLDFVHYLFREKRPLMELIESDVSFVNPLIAKYYPKDRHQLAPYRKQKGIEMEKIPTQRIRLEQTPERGGILTMPGILAMNRGPVLRGTWMLERILGEHLPEPPMDVGEVPPQMPGESLTFRQRFEAHRNQASCAICHDKIDPLGFAAQGYDKQGRFILTGMKTQPDGSVHQVAADGRVVDTSGILPNGTRFADFKALKHALKTEYRSAIIRNIVERTLSFALCRSLELHDRPTVDAMTRQLEESNGTYGDLLLCIVQSLPFRQTFVKADSL